MTANAFEPMLVYTPEGFLRKSVKIAGAQVVFDDACSSVSDAAKLNVLLPGFVDVHVHLREPGFSYKETIASGTAAGARGGYTALCAMPNLNPVPDSLEHLEAELEKIRASARIRVIPYGAVTVDEAGETLAEMERMAPFVAAFSDDGRGIQDPELMCRAMQTAKRLGKLIVAHCEDNRLLRGGYIHQGAYGAAHGHRGICSESEWRQVERDLELVRKTGCGYHVCHVSTKESVALIREAKRQGLDVTCETAPHYLLLDDSMLQEDGRFKMNPPIRERADREALIEGLLDGTVDIIATDHAPHSAEEKSRGLEKSLMGVVGLETAFPVLYTGLVRRGILSLEALVRCLAIRPRERFGIPLGEEYCLWDVTTPTQIDPETFLSKGRSTPFAGMQVYGRCKMTIYGGKMVWKQQ